MSGYHGPPRVPLEPLRKAIGPLYRESLRVSSTARINAMALQEQSPVCRIAELAGVSRRTVIRWAANGLDIYTADRVACAIGLHPWHIWTEWYDIECPAEMDQSNP